MVKFKNILGRGERANIENIQSDFVSLASHQLRTPLSAVKWNLELLMGKSGDPLTEKQKKYLREVYRSNERAINLVNDLLDVSRIQEGEIHLEYRPVRVDKVVEEVIDNLDTLIRTSKVVINFEVINGPLPSVATDQEKLKRIINNLLTNAIKYTAPGKSVKISVDQTDGNLRVSISDAGIGIAKKDQTKVFGKFFRSTQVIKLVPDGTGLGLFISKSLVEAMGGRIGFVSKENKGSTFYFTLPIEEKKDNA